MVGGLFPRRNHKNTLQALEPERARAHVVDCLSLSDTRLIALPPLGCLKSLKGCQCLALPVVLVQADLPGGADPSPAPDKDYAPKQIPLHLEGVEAGHVLRWIDPAQHDVFSTEAAGGFPWFQDARGGMLACLEEGEGQLAHGRGLYGEP